jgi:putrescine aminotransferase
MAGLVLVKDKATMEMFGADKGVGMVCRGHLFGNGMIMRAVGDRLIIAPPFVITRGQIDEMMGLIRSCLDAAHADIKARGWL